MKGCFVCEHNARERTIPKDVPAETLRWVALAPKCLNKISLVSVYVQGLQSRMQEFEESVQPLQNWLNRTEITVQESSTRLHDLPAKRLELGKLQVLRPFKQRLVHTKPFRTVNHIYLLKRACVYCIAQVFMLAQKV